MSAITLKNTFRLGFYFALLVLVLVLLAPFWWGFALFEHFRIYAGYGAIVVTGLGLYQGFRFRAVLLVGMAAYFLSPLWPYYFGPEPRALTKEDKTYRAMMANVLYNNEEKKTVLDAIKGKDPDVLLLLEITEEWVESLKELEEEYPYRVLEARPTPFGMWLLSRFPLTDVNVVQNEDGRYPVITANINFGDREMHFIGVHPPPPIGAEAAELHAIQISDFGHRMVVVKRPRMLMGDFNATPWSSAFRHLTAVTGLRDSAEGRGVDSTWGHGNFPFLPLPLDHCLVSDGIKVIGREVTRSIGSDHRGVVVEFALPRPEAEIEPPKARPFQLEDDEPGSLERAIIPGPGSDFRRP